MASTRTSASITRSSARSDLFIIFGIDAAGQALEDAGLTDMPEAERLRAGCSIGSGIGGLPGIESESLVLAEKGPRRVSPALRARPPHQPHLRTGLDQIRPDGPQSRGRDGLLDGRAFHRRRRPHDRHGRCRHHARGRRGKRDLSPSASPVSVRRARSPPVFARSRGAAVAPMMWTATASSWARARVSWCSRNMSMPRSGARRCMRRWSATASPAMPIM